MKSLTRLGCASILLALLFFSHLAAAQAQGVAKCQETLPPAGGCLTLEYDRFKDSTMAVLGFMVVDKGTDQRVMLMVMAAFDGSQPRGKVETALSTISVGTKVEPSRIGRQLLVLIDGDSRSTITLVSVKAETRALSGVSQEQLLTMLKPDELTRLVRAKTLEMKFGSDEFVFDETMRANLQRFCAAYCSLPTAH